MKSEPLDRKKPTNIFKRVSAVILCFLVGSFCCSGRTIQFMYFNQPPNAPQKAFMFEGEKQPIEVDLPKYHFTPCYEIGAGENTLYFLPALLEKEQGLPKGAPSVTIPAGWQKVLVVAYQDVRNSVMPVKFRAFDASPANFDNSDTLFINLSPKVVHGTLGNTPVVVNPDTTWVAKYAPADGEDYNVTLSQMNSDKSEDYRFLTKVFRHYTDRRRVFFIFMTDEMSEPDYYITTLADPIPDSE